MLSAGTLEASNLYVGLDQGLGLFSQNGGSATISSSLFACNASSGLATGVIDISGGTLVHTAGMFMDTGASGTAGYGVLSVRGSGYLQEQTPNFVVAANPTATGVVNLMTGGTLEVYEISASSGTSTINFNGGTLRAYATNGGASFLSGLTNAFIYSGGMTVDTNGQNIGISQNLSAPAGYALAAAGATISVASGGSGYIAPPVVTFALPTGGGVAATGVAVLSGGTVTGITITNPGSGYASGESVAVSFNQGDNSSGAALTPATAFDYAASATLNAGGGLTVIGGGTLTLSGTSNYSGPTAISAGTLELDVANGNNLPAATAVTIANGGVLDMGGVPQTVGSLSGSAGAIVTSRYSGNPTLTVASSAGSTTFAGNIISNVALALSGNGALTLSGTNSYTGGTTVSGGTLDIAAPSALSGSGLVTIAAGGRLVLGSGAGIGALLAASAPVGSDAVALSATAATPATIGEYESASGNTATPGGDALPPGGVGSAVGGSAAAVPEPGTIVLLAAGVVILAVVRRRSRG